MHKVFDFPFPDHFPPTLEQLFKLCRTLHSWLEADPFHVAVVHCMAGKGRTGTVIAAYLLFSGQCTTDSDCSGVCPKCHGGYCMVTLPIGQEPTDMIVREPKLAYGEESAAPESWECYAGWPRCVLKHTAPDPKSGHFATKSECEKHCHGEEREIFA